MWINRFKVGQLVEFPAEYRKTLEDDGLIKAGTIGEIVKIDILSVNNPIESFALCLFIELQDGRRIKIVDMSEVDKRVIQSLNIIPNSKLSKILYKG